MRLRRCEMNQQSNLAEDDKKWDEIIMALTTIRAGLQGINASLEAGLERMEVVG